MESGLERWLQPGRALQPLELRRGLSVIADLPIRIDEVLDRMRELVPDELALVTRGVLQRRVGPPQVARAGPPASRPAAYKYGSACAAREDCPGRSSRTSA
jgi:hypothetical protein